MLSEFWPVRVLKRPSVVGRDRHSGTSPMAKILSWRIHFRFPTFKTCVIEVVPSAAAVLGVY